MKPFGYAVLLPFHFSRTQLPSILETELNEQINNKKNLLVVLIPLLYLQNQSLRFILEALLYDLERQEVSKRDTKIIIS